MVLPQPKVYSSSIWNLGNFLIIAKAINRDITVLKYLLHSLNILSQHFYLNFSDMNDSLGVSPLTEEDFLNPEVLGLGLDVTIPFQEEESGLYVNSSGFTQIMKV